MKNTKTDIALFILVFLGAVFCHVMTAAYTFIAFDTMKFHGWRMLFYIAPYLYVQWLAFFAYYEKLRSTMLK